MAPSSVPPGPSLYHESFPSRRSTQTFFHFATCLAKHETQVPVYNFVFIKREEQKAKGKRQKKKNQKTFFPPGKTRKKKIQTKNAKKKKIAEKVENIPSQHGGKTAYSVCVCARGHFGEQKRAQHTLEYTINRAFIVIIHLYFEVCHHFALVYTHNNMFVSDVNHIPALKLQYQNQNRVFTASIQHYSTVHYNTIILCIDTFFFLLKPAFLSQPSRTGARRKIRLSGGFQPVSMLIVSSYARSTTDSPAESAKTGNLMLKFSIDHFLFSSTEYGPA